MNDRVVIDASVWVSRLMPLEVDAAVDVATKLQLRAGDSIYVALANQLNIPLVSWDKEQLQRTASVITTYKPSNYVF